MDEKYCKDCKHFVRGIWCEAPVNGIDLVTGRTHSKFATINRSKSDLFSNGCGIEGKHWEEKNPESKKKSIFDFLKFHI